MASAGRKKAETALSPGLICTGNPLARPDDCLRDSPSCQRVEGASWGERVRALWGDLYHSHSVRRWSVCTHSAEARDAHTLPRTPTLRRRNSNPANSLSLYQSHKKLGWSSFCLWNSTSEVCRKGEHACPPPDLPHFLCGAGHCLSPGSRILGRWGGHEKASRSSRVTTAGPDLIPFSCHNHLMTEWTLVPLLQTGTQVRGHAEPAPGQKSGPCSQPLCSLLWHPAVRTNAQDASATGGWVVGTRVAFRMLESLDPLQEGFGCHF